jgi:heat shock protein HslJ
MDSGTMQLAENPPPPQPTATAPPVVDPALTGKVWKWFDFQRPDGERIVVPNPDQYTVEFKSDGTVSVRADCNTGNGVFTASSGNINIEVRAMTLAACTAGSFSDQFVQGLNSVVVYRVDGGLLLMDLPMDSGTMQLAENPPAPQPTPTPPPQTDPDLVGKVWKWYEFVSPVGKTVVDIPNNYTADFKADGTVHVRADCNTGNGTYIADGSSIKVEVLAMTRAACPPSSLSDEFVRALNEAVLYQIEGGVLLMDLPMDSGTMKLAVNPPAPAPGVDPNLLGKVWQWTGTQQPDNEQFVVPSPSQYTAEFLNNNAVRIQADCNTGSGNYTADGSNISIQIGATTRAACPEGSLSDEFVISLNNAALYRIEGSELYIDLVADGGTMRFISGQ